MGAAVKPIHNAVEALQAALAGLQFTPALDATAALHALGHMMFAPMSAELEPPAPLEEELPAAPPPAATREPQQMSLHPMTPLPELDLTAAQSERS